MSDAPPLIPTEAIPTSAVATTEAAPPPTAPAVAQGKRKAVLPGGWFHGTGRRKTAVARVRIRPGEGEYLVNDRVPDQYFAEFRDRNDIVAPLQVTGLTGKLDVLVSVAGGGISGQAGAIKLGLARALVRYEPAHERALRDGNFLTRDSREVERKKYGRSGARRRFQFSKR